ncbi:Hypp2112 [Branchiostoma lanceolatum]|uniref:Hypp2112 protein n=1 Tax=Branchiostoma lanceolatum TaxID=7740 RepID=A0A8J9ZQB7_BRALA|nr:Hypp2112 [Branchiostoma lanceolatum]
MTRIRDENKYSSFAFIIDHNGKERRFDVMSTSPKKFSQKQFPYIFSEIEQANLWKCISTLLNVSLNVASVVSFPIKDVKKAVYNRFSPLDPLRHLKILSMVDFNVFCFTEGKIKDSQVIAKHRNGPKRLTLKSSPLKALENPRVMLGFSFGQTIPKPLHSFRSLSDCRPTVKQVCNILVLLCNKVKAMRSIFEVIKRKTSDSDVHSEIATNILVGWNDGCIPKVGESLEYFLALFVQSLYVSVFVKATQQNNITDSKPTEEHDKPIDKQQARARVPAMTKAGVKEHMASLRQMWCQEFSAGLAEDLLREDRQRALRRFGKELGLKQFEIDNVLNRSSASLKEKGRALMEDWQRGRCGSIVRQGKQLEEEHFVETLEALKRCKNSRGDREANFTTARPLTFTAFRSCRTS